MKNITMKDLKQKLGTLEEGEVILDVRSADEYRSGHVPGSKNIPHDQVDKHAAELGKFKRVYVHCQMGGRAGKAADILARLGLQNIVCVSGSGMGEWISLGYPVEK